MPGCYTPHKISPVEHNFSYATPLLETKKPITDIGSYNSVYSHKAKSIKTSIVLKQIPLSDFIYFFASEILSIPVVFIPVPVPVSDTVSIDLIDVSIPANLSTNDLFLVFNEILYQKKYVMNEVNGVYIITQLNISGAPAPVPTQVDNHGSASASVVPSGQVKDKKNIFYTYKPLYVSPSILLSSLKFFLCPLSHVDKSDDLLLLSSPPESKNMLMSALRQLDKPLLQYLVEITLAEVNLTDDFSMGFQSYLKSGALSLNIGSKQSTDLLTLSIDSDFLTGVLNTGQRAGSIKILSNPFLMAQNGKKSQITVGSEHPILSSESTNDITDRRVNRIEYKSSGIILSVEPLKIADRITSKLTVELSEFSINKTSKIDSPVLLKRKIETEILSVSGQSIVLAGLISSGSNDSALSLPPIFDRILFTGVTHGQNRTELIVILNITIIDQADNSYLDRLMIRFRDHIIK